MFKIFFTALSHRSFLRLTGHQVQSFLQGIISCDTQGLTTGKAIWGALLSPQGQFQHDLFIAPLSQSLNSYLLETDRDGREMLLKKLERQNFKKTIEITPEDSYQAYGLIGDHCPDLSHPYFIDPRIERGFWRCWVNPSLTTPFTSDFFEELPFETWDIKRITLGLPDGLRDLTQDKTLLLEAGFDELGGIGWQKGCYLGQEVTARSKFRGQVKKRLIPLKFEKIMTGQDKRLYQNENDIGTVTSYAQNWALAMIQISALKKALENQESIFIGTGPDRMKGEIHLPSWLSPSLFS